MKYFGILRDGYSDYCVLQQFISAIIQKHCSKKISEENFFDFEQLNISNAVAKYVSKSKTDYNLYNSYANDLRQSIITVLFAALKKFENEKDIKMSNRDILIINADAEKILKKKHNYFVEWAYRFDTLLWLAIEEFYDKMVINGYTYECLPLVFPVILFPSSEILVAACMYNFNRENFRNLKAKPHLKMRVYETDSIPEALENGKLREILSTFVTHESLNDVYKEIPETRKLIQSISFIEE